MLVAPAGFVILCASCALPVDKVFNTSVVQGVEHVKHLHPLSFCHTVEHLTRSKSDMATKSVNAKSQTIAARVPHEVANAMDELKEDGETTGQFVVTALQGEIKRRQRKKAKETPGD